MIFTHSTFVDSNVAKVAYEAQTSLSPKAKIFDAGVVPCRVHLYLFW